MTTRRPASPTGPRIYLDATRASTGTMLTSSYEPRYDTRVPRASFSAAPSSQSSSSRASTAFETQPVSKRTYTDHTNPGATISRTEYAIRPRRNSGAGESRRPLSLLTKNTTPAVEHVESPSQMVVYKPAREETPRLLPPGQSRGSAHHQRHNSATRAETGRYFPSSSNPRAERQYHARGPYVAKVAESRPVVPPARYEEPTYEYTNPREQFDRDFPAPAPVSSRARRASLTRKERPSSAIGTKFEAVPFRRETAPPPAVSRQLQRVDRDDGRSGFESDPDRARDVRGSRSNSIKGPIVHQRDDGYSSSRDDYQSKRSSLRLPHHSEESNTAGSKPRYRDANPDAARERERPRPDYERDYGRPHDRDHDRDRHERRHERTKEYERERERERPRPRDYEIIEDDHAAPRVPRRREHREDSDESPRSSGLKSLATAAVGGLAAATVAGHKSRKDDSPASDVEGRREAKHRRHRSQDRSQGSRHEDDAARERRRHRSDRKEHRQDSSGSDTPEDEKSRRRPHSRTRRRPESQDMHGNQTPKTTGAAPPNGPERQTTSDSVSAAPRGAEQLDNTAERTRQESPTNNEGRTLSPGEGEDGRPRKVSIVEPVKDQKSEARPKGILKPPRAVPFPEDPNPTREGVAPLKQAGKDGIPSGARWTKVSRILVNPEALERAHERFEERDDYVIVLRVLSREEIEKLAEKTREIREARERDWQKQVEERRRRHAERGERDTEDEDDYDEGPEPEPQPLAIEPAPSAPPADLRQFTQQTGAYQQQQQQPQMTYAPQKAYPSQHAPSQEWHQQPQPAQQWQEQHWAPQPQFQPPPPQQPQQPWNIPEVANMRNSAERIANTAPGQPIPGPPPGLNTGYNQPQPQVDSNTYSQNV